MDNKATLKLMTYLVDEYISFEFINPTVYELNNSRILIYRLKPILDQLDLNLHIKSVRYLKNEFISIKNKMNNYTAYFATKETLLKLLFISKGNIFDCFRNQVEEENYTDELLKCLTTHERSVYNTSIKVSTRVKTLQHSKLQIN